MNGRAFNASVKTLRFIVACHQRNQHSYPLRFAFSSQRSQQSLRNFPVPFAFQYADPVKVCTAAGCITSACDNRSIDSPNHLILFYSDERHGSIEPSIIKACFQLPSVGFISKTTAAHILHFIYAQFHLTGIHYCTAFSYTISVTAAFTISPASPSGLIHSSIRSAGKMTGIRS